MTPGAFAKVGIGARIILYAAVAGLLAGGLAVPAVGAVGLVTRNQTSKFNNMKAGAIGQLPVRSEILDSKGRLLAYFYPRGIDREPVTFSQISPIMRKAIVAIEDSRFYQHGAIDVRGTLRAIVYDLEHKQVQGGSTLTQQYVKNALILTAPNTQMAKQATSETLSRKIKELRLAIGVEGKMSEGPDPGGLPQRRVLRHLLRQPGGRRRGRRRAVLRHHRGQADPARGGHAGRDGGEPVPRQSRHQPRGGDQAAQRGAGPDGPAAHHHPGPRGGRRQAGTRAAPVPAADRLHQRLGQERRVLL